MYTYLEIRNQQRVEHYYGSVEFVNEKLYIKKPKGFYHVLAREIPLSVMENVIVDCLFGGARVSFSVENEYYEFYECGAGVIEYMQQHLLIVS